jgi:hypothetical protein
LKKLIEFNAYPVRNVLNLLLKDKTTKQNIVFATDSYSSLGLRYSDKSHIDLDILLGMDACGIQPRILKDMGQQVERTRKRAEVFTPAWVCNKMNNYCDDDWFGYQNSFNIMDGETWITNESYISFLENKTWKQYVDSKRLEITCGEAPYIVSRYDASTGENIDISRRIGILDRKLRVINENTDTEIEWLKWVIRAYQSVYGYEYQGDNLLIARINLLVTFVDYMQDKWNRVPTNAELRKIANIICWNIWQMDGITGTVPFGKPTGEYIQYSFFDYVQCGVTEDKEKSNDCKIYDWRSNMSITYKSIKEGR